MIGKSADLMAKMREDSEIEYRRHLQAAKYRQFNFSVKTSIETWNEENRLKVSVVNAELVNHQKHIQRLKAEIQALKNWLLNYRDSTE